MSADFVIIRPPQKKATYFPLFVPCQRLAKGIEGSEVDSDIPEDKNIASEIKV
jgi:hypothetical protein